MFLDWGDGWKSVNDHAEDVAALAGFSIQWGTDDLAEQPEPSRSDCHAWGSSPNIEFFRTILGIDSDGPGFSRILIEPSLGKLKEVSGTMPHPRGDIAVKYRVGKKGSLSAEITLPEGVEGELIWNGERKPLHGGFQQLTVR